MVSNELIRQFMLGLLDELELEQVARYLEAHPSQILEDEAVEDDAFLGRMRGAFGDTNSVPEREIPTIYSTAEGTTKSSTSHELPKPTSLNQRPMSSIPNLHPELSALDQYHFIGELGAGGMSLVYLAENLHMGRRKEALKILNYSLLRVPSAKERFEQEISVAAQLHHPNIVVAYSALRLKSVSVFAMEYVVGQDLHKLVTDKGPLRIATACGIIRQVAAGLQYAHEMKTIHRDIKPANLMLTKSGTKDIVKILDFGLAKAQMEAEKTGSLTGTNAGMGTAQYMAPEQMLSAANVDIRADIYSLGCTLYYLLAGRAPFGGSDYEIYQAHQSSEPKPLNLIRNDVPIELNAVISKMLAKTPDKRFVQPGEIVEALAPFMHLKNSVPIGKSVSEVPQDSDVPRTLPESTKDAVAQIQPVIAKTQLETMPKRYSARHKAIKTKPERRRNNWIPIAICGCLLFLSCFVFFSGILKVKTPNGTLVFQQLPNDADVLVDGERVIVTWDGEKEKATVQLNPGSHLVEVLKNGFKVEGTTVSISSGERTQLVVRAEPISVSETSPATPAKVNSPSPMLKPFTNSLGMKMVYIPPGEFMMGSPAIETERQNEFQHKVRITEGFYFGTHEVTRGQFAEFVTSGYTKNDLWNKSGFTQSDDHPIVNVSYEDAVAFAAWLSKKEGREYSLPSEAEWEYACRGGKSDSTAHWFGNSDSQLQDYANIKGTKGIDEFVNTASVGSFPSNPFGLHDMYGNVGEWCIDWYGDKYYQESPLGNPRGPASGAFRIYRGGGWHNTPQHTRSASRDWGSPSNRYSYLGFRLRSSVN